MRQRFVDSRMVILGALGYHIRAMNAASTLYMVYGERVQLPWSQWRSAVSLVCAWIGILAVGGVAGYRVTRVLLLFYGGISAPLWFCSTAVLIHGSDESFDNIECGSEARTDTLFQFPKSTEATTTKSTISSTSTSIPSISLGSSTSPPTGTGLKPSPIPTSSFTPSTTPSSTSSPPNPEPLNIGAIVGGAISGLTVICLTILGIVLIRRKHGAKRQATSAPDHVPHGENAFSDDAALDTYNSRDAQKSYLWDASHGPVELQGGRDLHVEAVELPGQGEHMDMSKGST
ncbi:hypothetical protein IAQ61_011367 [Plenodomus lingam]|uniref:uncharacterized protein n=1 Tax=Leptosphaeria maculans TaxID=5022 RepID=UPI0033343A0B|nr:hypothetical protein IAQ61_011367 [Plenodomus lingam]